MQNSTRQSNKTQDVISMTTCSAEVYLGSTCREELLSCSPHMDGKIDIPSNGNQEETEERVMQLSLGFQLLNPSLECMQVASHSFVCISLGCAAVEEKSTIT